MKNVLHTFLPSLLQAVLIVSLLSFTELQSASIEKRLLSLEAELISQQHRLGAQQEQLSTVQFTIDRRMNILQEQQGIRQ